MAWTAPSTWTSGAVLTAAQLNTQVRDNFKAIGDPWADYVPTWTASTTNPVLGNGTLAASYVQAGKLIHYRVSVTFGSTTTAGSGFYELTLPVPAAADWFGPTGVGLLRKSGGAVNGMVLQLITATKVRGALTATDAFMGSSSTTWANGDRFDFTGTYEAA